MTKPLSPEELETRRVAREAAHHPIPSGLEPNPHGTDAHVGAPRTAPMSEARIDEVLADLEKAGLVERVSSDVPTRLTGADRSDPRADGAFEERPRARLEEESVVETEARLEASRRASARETPGGDPVEIARPSICRAVCLRRISFNVERQEYVESAEVAAVVQKADGLVIDCYAIGKLDVDGGGARGGLHELKCVKHESLADQDGVYWAYPTRV